MGGGGGGGGRERERGITLKQRHMPTHSFEVVPTEDTLA